MKVEERARWHAQEESLILEASDQSVENSVWSSVGLIVVIWPNSVPPERLFSLFNATYNDDQKKSHADYIELSMQSQFNKRGL